MIRCSSSLIQKKKKLFLQGGLIGASNFIWESVGHEEDSAGGATALQPCLHAQQEKKQRMRKVRTKKVA